MKKLLLLSALLIFACSSDDSSDDNQLFLEKYDSSGIPYASIVYGTQEWTVENACHTTYRDGTPIPQVTDDDEWLNLTTGAWCYYDNDPNKGVLYNWYAVRGIHDNDPNTPDKEFAPQGWHVPSHSEWISFRIKGSVYSNESKIKVDFDSPKIKVFNNYLGKVKFKLDNFNPLYNAYISIDTLDNGFYNLKDFNFINKTINDTLYVSTNFSGGKNKEYDESNNWYRPVYSEMDDA